MLTAQCTSPSQLCQIIPPTTISMGPVLPANIGPNCPISYIVPSHSPLNVTLTPFPTYQCHHSPSFLPKETETKTRSLIFSLVVFVYACLAVAVCPAGRIFISTVDVI